MDRFTILQDYPWFVFILNFYCEVTLRNLIIKLATFPNLQNLCKMVQRSSTTDFLFLWEYMQKKVITTISRSWS